MGPFLGTRRQVAGTGIGRSGYDGRQLVAVQLEHVGGILQAT